MEAIIRIGTCGAFQKQTKLKDLIIAEGACTNSNWMGQHNLYGGSFSAIADYELLSAAVDAAKAGKFRFQVGNIVSSDTFYDYRPDTWKKWANLGALGVEMEAFALYEQAAELGKKALAICSVSDSFVNEGILTAEERQEGLSAMVMVALVTAEKFNAWLRSVEQRVQSKPESLYWQCFRCGGDPPDRSHRQQGFAEFARGH